MSSELALLIPTKMIHYSVTKMAQLALWRGLAELTAGTNVTVNSILVGPTRSEGVVQYIESQVKEKGISEVKVEKNFFRDFCPASLIKRFALPQEVANLVTYVCSPLASATNGATLRAEGGAIKTAV